MTQMCTRRLNRVFYRLMKGQVVVLDQYAIEEPHAVIHSAPTGYRVFIEHAEPGGGLSCIDNTRARALDAVDILACQGRDAAHALQQVERGSFGGEDGTCGATQFSDGCTGCDGRTFQFDDFEFKGGVDKPDDLSSYRNTGN